MKGRKKNEEEKVENPKNPVVNRNLRNPVFHEISIDDDKCKYKIFFPRK